MHHTNQCLEAQARLKSYQEKYPHSCTRCSGTGLVYVSGDWVPYGMGSTQLPGGEEPCHKCEEIHLCPRCGTDRVWHEEGNPNDSLDGYHKTCPVCGFICIACQMPGYEKQETCPEFECYCWEEEAREEAEEYLRSLTEQSNRCPHGCEWHECNTCMVASDLAYDAKRENR